MDCVLIHANESVFIRKDSAAMFVGGQRNIVYFSVYIPGETLITCLLYFLHRAPSTLQH